MKTRITQNSTLNYPLISGFCRTVPDTAPQMVNAVPTIDPATVDVSPAANAGFIDEVRGGTQLVFQRTANGYSLVRTGLGRIAERALGVVQSAGRLLPERFAGL